MHRQESTVKFGLIRKLQSVIPKTALLTICKPFLRPHLDYGGVIYGRAFKKHFKNRLELVKYNAALAITGAIRVSSKKEPLPKTAKIMTMVQKVMLVLET